MKLLFITTYNVTIQREHFFTINVIDGLIDSRIDMAVLTIHSDKLRKEPLLEKESYKGIDYYHLYLPHASKKETINHVRNCFAQLNPQVIHSNMDNGLETEAAYPLGIPTVLTIHIGGVICPRGGGNGFLHYDDEICPTTVGHKNCMRCCCQDLPGKDVGYFSLKMLPLQLQLKLSRWIKTKPFLYYFTPLLSIPHNIENSIDKIDILKKTSSIISANNHLKEILERNGIEGNVKIIPHGVKERKRLPFPPIKNGVIKFYYLGRVQYSKGLHLALKAMKKLPVDKYEFHIIGSVSISSQGIEPRKEKRYLNRLKKMTSGMPITFHGRLDNTEIESLIKDFHIMLHPTICLEVFGIAIAESLSIGRPVLATKCGGTEMQIKDGYNGWLIEPNNIEELINKMRHLIENIMEIVRCSNNATIPKFDSYIEELDKLYNSIVIQNHE